MDKNTIIALAVAIVAWFGWDAYLKHKYPNYDKEKVVQAPSEKAAPNQNKGDYSSGPNASSIVPNSSQQQVETDIAPKANNNIPLASKKQLTYETDDVLIEFSQQEGTVKRITLKNFKQDYVSKGFLEGIKSVFQQKNNETRARVELINDKKYGAFYFKLFENQSFGRTFHFERVEDTFIFSSTFPQAVKIEKKYSFEKNYLIKLDISITNLQPHPFSATSRISMFDIDPMTKEPSFFTSGGLIIRNSVMINAAEGSEKIALKSYIDEPNEKYGLWSEKGLHVRWIGQDTQYFLKALMPNSQKQNGFLQLHDKNIVEMGLVESIQNLLPQQKVDLNYKVYIGPKNIDQLEATGKNLEESIDFGWFGIIAVPILKLLKLIYSFVGNFGLAIIILTAFLKVLLLPLTWKASISMKRMQILQPELKKIQAKFKDDKTRVSSETMKFMKDNKMNPLGGCLPMLPQIPIFFSLYRVMINSIELRHTHFLWWITDLAAKDPLYILPVITGAFMFMQQKIMPTTSTDPNQKMMFLMMNGFFTFMMLFLPSGAVLYICTNMALSMLQQLAINKYAKV